MLMPAAAVPVFFLSACRYGLAANQYKPKYPSYARMAPGHKTKAVTVADTGAEETERIRPVLAVKLTKSGAGEYNRAVLATKLERGGAHVAHPPANVPKVQIITNSKFSAAIAPPSKLGIAFSEAGSSAQDLVKSDPQIAVAINGGYYDSLDGRLCPVGLLVCDGVMLWMPSPRVANGEDKEREAFGPKAKKESEWYMAFFVNRDGNAGILPIRELVARTNPECDDLQMACEAGPSILKSGQINSPEISKRGTGGMLETRTAIGISESGDAVLFCSKIPMTLYDAAGEMKKLGAVDAIALDGGPEVSFEAPQNPDARISAGVPTCLIIYVKP